MKKKLILFGAALLTTYCVIGLARADEITFQCHDKQITVDSDLGLSGVEKICVNESYVCEIFGGEMHCTVKR